jgi:hypothetical protein
LRALEGVGSSNTRPRATSGPSAAVVTEAGVDTWRLAFDTSLAIDPSWRRYGEGGSFLREDASGYMLQWYPGFGRLCVEGHPRKDGLCPPWELEDAYQELLDSLAENGITRLSRFAGVSRLDSTVTQRFGNPREGQAVLMGIAALDIPWCKPKVVGRPPETVYLIHERGRGRVLGRAYDKGLEAGTAERGELVRLEDQRRFAARQRPGRDAFHADYVRGRFEQRFRALWRSAKGVKVAAVPVVARELAARACRGEITHREMERLAGFVLAEVAGVAKSAYPDRTYKRRRAELREQGLVVADAFFEPVEVDLGLVLERALETPMWTPGIG